MELDQYSAPAYPTGYAPRLDTPVTTCIPVVNSPHVTGPITLKKTPTKHSHYYKDVSKYDTIDVYRVLALFGVTDQTLGHAIKKLLVAGGRGAKDLDTDVQEAIDTLTRFLDMRKEDSRNKILVV